MAWVTIWASSIAAKAGESHPFEDKTSTQAWISRTDLLSIDSVSDWSSGGSCSLDKWACEQTKLLVHEISTTDMIKITETFKRFDYEQQLSIASNPRKSQAEQYHDLKI